MPLNLRQRVTGARFAAASPKNFALGSFLLRLPGRRDAGRPGYFGFCFFAAREAGCALGGLRGA
jgi:hypothetical protein